MTFPTHLMISDLLTDLTRAVRIPFRRQSSPFWKARTLSTRFVMPFRSAATETHLPRSPEALPRQHTVSRNGLKIKLGHISTSRCAMSADAGGRIYTKAEKYKRRQMPWNAPVVPVLVG